MQQQTQTEPDKSLFEFEAYEEEQEDILERKSESFWKGSFQRLLKNKGAIISLVVLILITVISLVGPFFNEYHYAEQDIARSDLPPLVHGLEWLGLDGTNSHGKNVYDDRSMTNEPSWLGTDEFGRDLWTRIWKGTQISLLIGVVAALLDLLIGVIYGGISGFYGGKLDDFMQRVLEVLMGIPNLILIMLFILVLQPGIFSIILALIITGWVNMARIVRGQMLQLKGQEFIMASRALGATNKRLIWKHLIPNTLGPIIVTVMFTIPTAIYFEAFLSFIGLGIQPPLASLGTLIEDGFQNMQYFSYKLIYPAIVISAIMVSFNILGDGLRDALDPKMKTSEKEAIPLAETILSVDNLEVSFKSGKKNVNAVRGVSFDLKQGETLAIVGESGSGKSVTAKSIMKLLPKESTVINNGTITDKGEDLLKYRQKDIEKIRGKDISMVFQDPMTSLNPTMKVGKQVVEGLRKHQNLGKQEAYDRGVELLRMVGIPKPENRMNAYPHQFSGGMRQRVVIAIALSSNPNVLIADEPTTALDVTIQAQILDLMKDLQKKTGTSIIIITHDLGVVANIADRVAVMYAGEVMETGTVEEIFYESRHPYTWGLLQSMPNDHNHDEPLIPI